MSSDELLKKSSPHYMQHLLHLLRQIFARRIFPNTKMSFREWEISQFCLEKLSRMRNFDNLRLKFPRISGIKNRNRGEHVVMPLKTSCHASEIFTEIYTSEINICKNQTQEENRQMMNSVAFSYFRRRSLWQ